MELSFGCRGQSAIIIGGRGQDGHLLRRQLESEGVNVVCTSREPRAVGSCSEDGTWAQLDVTSAEETFECLSRFKPDECYMLAAQSSVSRSAVAPLETFEINCVGVANVLEGIRRFSPGTRVFVACSGEIFAGGPEDVKDEYSKTVATSIYGASKLGALVLGKAYRELYGLFVTHGILFNHESPLRPELFVSQKIARAAQAAAAGSQDVLVLGNLDVIRDWSYAGDIVQGMRLAIRATTAQDFVFATGVGRSIRDFCSEAYRQVGLPLTWIGSGAEQQGLSSDGRLRVRSDVKFIRKGETTKLVGNPAMAYQCLGWAPRTTFSELIALMLGGMSNGSQ